MKVFRRYFHKGWVSEWVNQLLTKVFFITAPATPGLLKRAWIANIGLPLDVFMCFCNFNVFFAFKYLSSSFSSQASLLCIVGELASGGSVAVGVSDRWQVQATSDTWHVTRDMWHMTRDTWFFYVAFLSISVRFGIGATICKSREIQCLLYAGFSLNWPTGPIRSSSRNVRPYPTLFLCPLPMQFFCVE